MSKPSRYADEAPGGGLLAKLYSRASLTLLGLLALALVAGLLGLSIAVFTHAFDDPARVSLSVERAGLQLGDGADVKLNGIVVGRVDAIEPERDGSGATLQLAIDRDYLDQIPANITAGVLPKTIFGEKYVDLALPREPTVQRLTDGAHIQRDNSSVAIETITVLNNLAPLLQAVDPAALNTTLTAISTALNGRGELLGETITSAQAYTGQLRSTVPDLIDGADLLADVSDSYTRASDPLLRALSNTTTTARTLTAQQQDLERLLLASGEFAEIARGFVNAVGETAVEVVVVSRPVLEMLKKYSPEFACLIRGVVKAKDRLEALYAAGPYLRSRLFLTTSRGMYEPGIDSPKSTDLSAYGPQCPVLPSDASGSVPWPEIPHEYDQLQGEANPLNSVNGLPGQLVTGDAVNSGELLQLLLGGALG